MAKKNQIAHLQIEINKDEEWEKLINKEGLILIDIYSEWCGPCSAMQAVLKKIKLEIGGDMLVLAVAKADSIRALERFRENSEPTWMFISKGKMVNLTYGADSPRLQRLIIEELKKEQGTLERQTVRDISELSDEEQIRFDAAETIRQEVKENERQKKAKEIYDRKLAEVRNVLDNVDKMGLIIIFPHAKDKYKEALNDLISEAGLVVKENEKLKTTKEIIAELLYFADQEWPEASIEEITKAFSWGLILKRTSDLPANIDDIVLQVVYGNMRKPPGDENSPNQKLVIKNIKKNEDNEEEVEDLIGVWAPPNELTKGMALKLLFPKISDPYKLPEEPEIPLHVLMGYDAFKARDIMELSKKFPGQVMSFGFFTSDVPGNSILIAKTVDAFETKTIPTTYDEKVVIQLAKTDPACFEAFEELGPTYQSRSAIEGEKECKMFFPEGYNAPIKKIVEAKKKSKKKGKKPTAVLDAQDGEIKESEGEILTGEKDHGEEDTLIGDDQLEGDIEDHESGEEDEDEEDEKLNIEEGKEEDFEEGISEADKATSPMN